MLIATAVDRLLSKSSAPDCICSNLKSATSGSYLQLMCISGGLHMLCDMTLVVGMFVVPH